MNIVASAAACCAHSTLAAYEETNKATLAAQEKTNKAEPNKEFDWEQNATNLRRLKQENSSLNRDELDIEED